MASSLKASTTRSVTSFSSSSAYNSATRSAWVISTTSATHSSTFVPVITDEYDPYVFHYKDKNGTVFIAVGTIIITLFVLLLSARFWYWLKNRKAVQDASKFDDYYGGGAVSFYDDDKSDINFLAYDPASFADKKNGYGNYTSTPSSNLSAFTHSSTSSSSVNSITDNHSRVDLSNMTSQPGHNLRSAWTQSYVPPKNRHSFISPINQLLQEQYPSMQTNIDTADSGTKRLSSNQLLDAFNVSSPVDHSMNDSSPSINASSREARRRKTQSISYMINTSSPDANNGHRIMENGNHSNNNLGYGANVHSRSTSLDLHELEKLIHKSLAENRSRENLGGSSSTPKHVTSSSPSSSSPSCVPNTHGDEQKKKSRPPSIVLDMLVQNEMDL